MAKQTIIIILGVVILAAGGFFLLTSNQNKSTQSPQSNVTSPAQQAKTFQTPKKAAHYESNTPAHEAILAAYSYSDLL